MKNLTAILTEEEKQSRLDYIKNHQTKFQGFVDSHLMPVVTLAPSFIITAIGLVFFDWYGSVWAYLVMGLSVGVFGYFTYQNRGTIKDLQDDWFDALNDDHQRDIQVRWLAS